MYYLLQLRVRQGYRSLREVGWLLLLIVTPMLAIFLLGLLEKVQFSGVPVIALVGLGLLLTMHARRQDSGFLRLLNYAPCLVFLMEYSLAVLPLSLMAILALSDWLNPLLLQLGAVVMALLPSGFSTWFKPRGGMELKCWPTRFFEMKCALRKDYFPALLIYLIGLATAMFTVSVPLVVLLFVAMAGSAFDAIENKELLEVTVLRKQWLQTKILEQTGAFHLVMLPLYLLFLLFHYSYWYILAAVIVIVSGVLTFAISYKYAHYYPGRKKSNNQLPVALFLLFLLNPFFAPATLVFLWIYYRRAIKNMKLYY
jgi:hypothetical protein